jgi:hypothetical protein
MALLAGMSGFAEAQRADGCGLDKKFPKVQDGGDMVIKVDCTVEAGIYKVGNVNIIKGGTLRFADATIDFWAKNILVESGGSLIAGALPDDPKEPCKDPQKRPIGCSGVVTIYLYGQDATGQDPEKRGAGIKCLGPEHTDKPEPPSDPERCGVPKDIWESNVNPNTHEPVLPERARKISGIPSAKDYLGFTDDYFYPYQLPVDGQRLGALPRGGVQARPAPPAGRRGGHGALVGSVGCALLAEELEGAAVGDGEDLVAEVALPVGVVEGQRMSP